MRFTERVLEQRKTRCYLLERRFDCLKTFQRVAQTLAGDPKVVKALLVALLQTAGQRAHFAETSLQDAVDELVDICNAAQIDAFGLHLRRETHAAKRLARVARCHLLLLA